MPDQRSCDKPPPPLCTVHSFEEEEVKHLSSMLPLVYFVVEQRPLPTVPWGLLEFREITWPGSHMQQLSQDYNYGLNQMALSITFPALIHLSSFTLNWGEAGWEFLFYYKSSFCGGLWRALRVWAGTFVPNGQVKSIVAVVEVGSHDTWLPDGN